MTKNDLLRFFSRNASPLLGIVIAATSVLVVHQVLFAHGSDSQKPEQNQQQTESTHAAASGEQDDRQKNDDHRDGQGDKGNSNPKGHDDKHAKDSEEKRRGHKPGAPDSDHSSSAATVYCPPDPVDGWKGFLTSNNQCSEQKIVSITGLKKTYAPKEPIQLTIDGILTDGSAATPDGGWNVQYYTYSVTDPVNYLQEYMDSGNFNATFPDGHYHADYWAPQTSGKYFTTADLYCSFWNTKCMNFCSYDTFLAGTCTLAGVHGANVEWTVTLPTFTVK